MTASSATRPQGRPRKNGRRVGLAVPADFADAVNSWGPQYTRQTDRIEALVQIGLEHAPRHHRPLSAAYAGPPTPLNANLSPDVAKRVMGPVRSKRTNITRRMMTLLHYGMLAERVELALEAAGMFSDEAPLKRTGTM